MTETLSLKSIAAKSFNVSPPFSVVKDIMGFVHTPPASLKRRLQMKGKMKQDPTIHLKDYMKSSKDYSSKGVSVRSVIEKHLAVFGEKINSNSVISLQKVLTKNFNIVVFGDSIAWGQGLKTKDKFSHIVKDKIAKAYPATDVFIKTFAQSGAPIKPEKGEDFKSGLREMPSDFPTILQQVQNFKGMRKAVDLILVDGGINDIGSILIALGAEGNVTIETACHERMKDLLEAVTGSYANALVVTTGYYPVVSHETDAQSLISVVSLMVVAPEIGVPLAVTEGFLSHSASSSKKFADESTKKIKLAIEETNRTLYLKQIYFANPEFKPKNSVLGSDPWLWGVDWDLDIDLDIDVDVDVDFDIEVSWEEGIDIVFDVDVDVDVDWKSNFSNAGFMPEDPKWKYRAKHSAKYESLFRQYKAEFASFFHPNPKGAKKYADEIVKALKKAGLLTT